MPRKTTVNDETVGQAVDALVQEGLDPTLERMRSKLGGGSYTTINRVLTEVLQKRQTHATQISEVPSDLVEIGQRAVAAIYAAVQRQAASKIELIETNSRKLIDAANHARPRRPSRSNGSKAKPNRRRRPSRPPTERPRRP
jgi:hypothetical protein